MQIDADKVLTILNAKRNEKVKEYIKCSAEFKLGEVEGIDTARKVIMKMAREQYGH